MISGVSNIIFASGDRISDRNPANAMADTGSDTPGKRTSNNCMPVFLTATGDADGAITSLRTFRAVNWPWYSRNVVR
jgi:hypothetical protein